MDIDKETVQVVAIVGIMGMAMAALFVDGETGAAMGLAMSNAITFIVGYLFGGRTSKGGETDAEEVSQ